jgi:GT2 family glycosyltransferase
MALIAMAVYDTEENNRTELTRQTIRSLLNTVDWRWHRLIISDNGSCQKTLDCYSWPGRLPISVIWNGSNIGTARAINNAWKQRLPDEVAVKMDNDVVIHQSGWLDEIEEVFRRDPKIGICGLKRKDLEERPDHPNHWYASKLRMLPHDAGQPWLVVEEVNHVMGTCQAYNPLLLKKIGYLYQMQDEGNLYGFDDSLASLRAHLAGFKTVFLPHIEIDHVDPGGSAFCNWKTSQAGSWMHRYNIVVQEYKNGKRPLYYEDSQKEKI